MIEKIIEKLTSFLGYEIKVCDYYNKISEWKNWYKGYVKDFHSSMEQGRQIRKYSMGMAKKIGEDYSALVVNEQTKIKTDDKKVLEFLVGDEDNNGGVFKQVNFWKNINDYCERMYGYAGSIAAIVGLNNAELDNKNGDMSGGNYSIRFCTSEHIIPISWNGGDVSEAAFFSVKSLRGNTYVILEIITKDGAGDKKGYKTQNKIYMVKNGELADTGAAILDQFSLANNIFWEFKPFAICNSNISNNYIEGFPLGIPAIANALDEIKICDIYFNNFAQDGALGKKRLFISEEFIETETITDSSGKISRRPINPEYSQSPFYVMKKDNMLNGSASALWQEFNPVLRVQENKEAIQQALNILSLKAGFGNQFYVFDQAGYVTATQVRASNMALTYNINKQRTPYWRFIQDICRSLIALANTNGAGLNENAEIIVEWDDSLLSDPLTEKTADLQAVSTGVLTPWEYRVKWYGDTEENAKKILADEKTRNPGIDDLFNLPTKNTSGNE